MTTPIRIAVCGASGRTGSRVAALASIDPRFHLTTRVDRARSNEFEEQAEMVNVAVDFSIPQATVRYAQACAAAKTPFVTGTTGLTSVQMAQLTTASKKIPLFIASNFSRGVALMNYLAQEAARRLSDYDVVIVETHHKEKKDSPSGTALRLARAVQEGSSKPGAITTQSIRLSDVVGDHELTFAGPFERLTLKHQAQSRDVFARGALDVAAWLIKKKPGLYGMEDFLGLK